MLKKTLLENVKTFISHLLFKHKSNKNMEGVMVKGVISFTSITSMSHSGKEKMFCRYRSNNVLHKRKEIRILCYCEPTPQVSAELKIEA